MIVDKEFSIHPSDEELASFIDNRLKPNRREFIKKHILECRRCRSCVVGGVREKRKTTGYVNNINYFVPLALVASLVIIFVPIIDESGFTKSLEVVKVSLFDMFIEWVKSLF